MEKLAKSGKPVELRVPVAKGLTMYHIDEVKKIISMFDPGRVTVVVNPLVTEPLTNPRNKEWCERHCYKGNMPEDEAKLWEEQISNLGFKVKVKRWINE